MTTQMNAGEIKNKLDELEISIKAQQDRISDGREVMKTLGLQLNDSKEELRRLKVDLKRKTEEDKIESECEINLAGVWGDFHEMGFSKKEIHVLQNFDLTHKKMGLTLGVSVERARQIRLRCLRRCKHPRLSLFFKVQRENQNKSESRDNQFDSLLDILVKN
jgi:hypothetical protein